MRKAGIVIAVAALAAVAGYVALSTPEPASAPATATAPMREGTNAVLVQPLAASSGQGTLRGRVVANGQPVPRATVTATRAEPSETLSELPCDCDDSVTLVACDCEEPSAQLEALVSERRGEVVPVARTQAGLDGTFELGGLGSGRVSVWADDPKWGTALEEDLEVGASGIELELGAGISIAGKAVIDGDVPAAGAWVTLVHAGHSRFFDAIADAEGRFRFGPVPDATYAVIGGRAGLLPASAHPFGASQEVLLGLSTPRTIRGVVEQDGVPVAGASIRLEEERGERETTSSGNGQFTFERLREGEVHLSATYGDLLASAEALVPAKGDPPLVHLALAEGAVITGHVRSKGVPVVGATFSIGTMEIAEVKTAADGSYRIVTEPVEGHMLKVERDGYARESRDVDLHVGRQQLDFELVPEALIAGVVVDAETKEPLSDVSVDAQQGRRGRELADVRTGPHGELEIKGLAAGRYQLTAEGAEHLSTVLEVMAPDTQVVLAMSGGLQLSGTVVDESGAGVARARIVAGSRGRSAGQASSLDGGAFTLRGLVAGTWELSARAANQIGRARVTLPGAAPPRIVLIKEQTISGVVVDDSDKPVSGVGVFAMSVGRHEYTRSTAMSGPDGRFEVTTRAPGEYDVYAVAPGQSVNLDRATRAKSGATGVRVVAGTGAKVRGRVVTAKGAPLTNFSVQGRPISNPEGRFEVPAYRSEMPLRVEAEGYMPVTRSVRLVPPVTDVGTIVLGEGRDVKLTITSRATGQPLANATVWPAPSIQASRDLLARCDTQGVAVVRGVPPGPAAFEVRDPTHVRRQVQVEADGVELAVVLDQGSTLVVEVVDPEGDPRVVKVRAVCLDELTRVVEVPLRQMRGVLEGLRPGPWLVMATGNESLATKSVTLPPQGQVSVRLELVSGSATVQLQLERGPAESTPSRVDLVPATVPVSGRFDDVSFISEPGVETDTPMQFEFHDLPPGAYQAIVWLGRDSYVAPVQVTTQPLQRIRVPAPTSVTAVRTGR